MELAATIVLAVAGLGALLTGFGGDTWRKGPEPFLQRITRRGWVSLAFVLIALIAGEPTHTLAETSTQIGDRQRSAIETAFSKAVEIPREADGCAVTLSGAPEQTLPSRHGDTMLLYWGDKLQYRIVPQSRPEKPRRPDPRGDLLEDTARMKNYEEEMGRYRRRVRSLQPPSLSELKTLRLKAGDRKYELFRSSSKGSLEISGNSPKPMDAIIVNPLGLKGVELEIAVSTDPARGLKEFKNLVLDSAFSEFARRRYQAVTADLLRLRKTADTTSPILTQLPRGSFVEVLQTADSWSEIATPEGRRGWVASEYLGEIR